MQAQNISQHLQTEIKSPLWRTHNIHHDIQHNMEHDIRSYHHSFQSLRSTIQYIAIFSIYKEPENTKTLKYYY